MTEDQATARAPWHLWVVGLVSLIWNGAGGGSDYVLTKTGNEAYLQMAADMVGITTEEVNAYFDAFPLWMDVFWAVGVWGAVAGSLLLLLRNRYAFHAFIASAVGIAVSGFYQITTPLPGATDTTTPMVMTVLVCGVTAALIYYCWRLTKSGVLR